MPGLILVNLVDRGGNRWNAHKETQRITAQVVGSGNRTAELVRTLNQLRPGRRLPRRRPFESGQIDMQTMRASSAWPLLEQGTNRGCSEKSPREDWWQVPVECSRMIEKKESWRKYPKLGQLLQNLKMLKSATLIQSQIRETRGLTPRQFDRILPAKLITWRRNCICRSCYRC